MDFSTQDLQQALSVLVGSNDSKISDASKYRYVIYARKSTDDKDRQARSLPDQIIECQEFAEENNLTVLPKPIQESESAKYAGLRPKFQAMLNDLSKGKYEGIIVWHPDRLARNMKDAGEIIDLLDKGVIKDLKFVSFTFENNSMGKMLLGIAFVLSKQYSDSLSDNVKRGNRRSIGEGKYISAVKHGYYKNRDQFLRPDKYTYHLIKQAFQMRLQGKGLEDIASFLNQNNYTRAHILGDVESRKSVKFDKQKISPILKDPIYAGVLLYGNNDPINFTEVDPDFLPMITVDEYLEINNLPDLKKAIKLKRKRAGDERKAMLMRGMIVCSDCGSNMTAGITHKKTKDGKTNYFYYRCDNPKCKNKGKSVRAKTIVDFVIDFLNKNKFTSKDSYNQYSEEMKRIIKEQGKQIENELYSANQLRTRELARLEKIKIFLLDEKDEQIKRTYKDSLKESENRLKEFESKIGKLKFDRENGSQAILGYEKYLELFDNLAKHIQKIISHHGKMEDLDFIIRKIFLNFTIQGKKVANYTINSPFREYIENSKVLTCRGDRT